ncbi:DUF3899 domain-containing protein [Neobacillus soli]|uniref:DUF3899 domain-containing protein n=1 Tax=Neobacillus soli TaxID=220688 RepID=UPI0008254B40|nr:DUF3899 domain-containing protein [Neobacillus soli]
MNFRFKKRLIILVFIQLAILVTSFIFHHKISLVSYINISFYITSFLLLTSLLLYTIQSGFYDIISRSFNLFFSRGQNKRSFEEIPRLSELITVDQKPLLFYGLFNGLFMVIALFIYYL